MRFSRSLISERFNEYCCDNAPLYMEGHLTFLITCSPFILIHYLMIVVQPLHLIYLITCSPFILIHYSMIVVKPLHLIFLIKCSPFILIHYSMILVQPLPLIFFGDTFCFESLNYEHVNKWTQIDQRPKFKEFEPWLKYGWFPLKLYSIF